MDSELVVAVGHSNKAGISASQAARHACNLKFVEAVARVFISQGGQHKTLEELFGGPCDERVEEGLVHLL